MWSLEDTLIWRCVFNEDIKIQFSDNIKLAKIQRYNCLVWRYDLLVILFGLMFSSISNEPCQSLFFYLSVCYILYSSSDHKTE